MQRHDDRQTPVRIRPAGLDDGRATRHDAGHRSATSGHQHLARRAHRRRRQPPQRPALVAGFSFLDTAARHSAKSRAFNPPCQFPGSSVVERRTVNPLVAGSNPARGANLSAAPSRSRASRYGSPQYCGSLLRTASSGSPPRRVARRRRWPALSPPSRFQRASAACAASWSSGAFRADPAGPDTLRRESASVSDTCETSGRTSWQVTRSNRISSAGSSPFKPSLRRA